LPFLPNFDPDAVAGVWDHWVVFNIPAGTIKLAEGEAPKGTVGKNTAAKNTYIGPCPPDKEHRYFFKLYALDAELELPKSSTKAEVEKAMEGHIIEKAQLMGRYDKQR